MTADIPPAATVIRTPDLLIDGVNLQKNRLFVKCWGKEDVEQNKTRKPEGGGKAALHLFMQRNEVCDF